MRTKFVSFSIILFLIFPKVTAQTWEFVGLDSMVITNLNVSGDCIWAGTAHRVGNQDRSGLYFTTDSGNNWVQIDSALGDGVILGFDLVPPLTLFILKGSGALSVAGNLYKSTNNGETWDSVSNNINSPIKWFGISPFNKNEVYALTYNPFPAGLINILYKSTDGGNTWINNSAFPGSSHGSALAFAFDLIDSMNLYVTVDTQFDQYFYKSINQGESWLYVSSPPSWPVIYTDYFITNRIYLFPEPYVSNDGGLSWFLADSGLPDTSYYLSFYQDKETTKLLYNLRRDGLYSSRNDTIYWQLVEGTDELPLDIGSAGFRFADVGQMTNLFINQVNDIIYIGTAQGIYKSSVLTNAEDKVEKIIDNFSLNQNYPNPFNPITTISYHVPETSFITIKVYDVLGNEIATLVNEELEAGKYEIDFIASDLPSGIYFYTFRSGSFVKTKKMLLTHLTQKLTICDFDSRISSQSKLSNFQVH